MSKSTDFSAPPLQFEWKISQGGLEEKPELLPELEDQLKIMEAGPGAGERGQDSTAAPQTAGVWEAADGAVLAAGWQSSGIETPVPRPTPLTQRQETRSPKPPLPNHLEVKIRNPETSDFPNDIRLAPFLPAWKNITSD
ncbi:hypothetical protein JRQ81_014400 [Phrynocephalus forsythii]|uniref:Uncharacterized protein n=1 Tax=Phrynocephalus forsythii TaxID=171643 RepID=A0A9Q1B3H2_9SAUR|nr:hypothetical protein JRQ81_014400 [Phrynocephalus forsythii]